MDFKKCTAFLLAFLLLVSNAGLAFNVHYCGGKMASVSSVFASGKACKMEEIKIEKPCCAKKIALEHKKCCKDKTVQFKSKLDQSIVKFFSFSMAAPFVSPVWNQIYKPQVLAAAKSQITDYCCDANAPPLFCLYSQYIFYA